jgi:hypothetical protein
MTACPYSSLQKRSLRLRGDALVWLVFVLAVLVLPQSAWALSGEPTQLGVPAVPEATQPPSQAPAAPSGTSGIETAPLPPLQPAPAATGTAQPGEAAGPAVPAVPGTMSDSPLASAPAALPLPPTAGLPAGMAGLGADLWQSSEVSRLMALVPRLPAPVRVPSLRDLQVRLLATDAPSAGAAPGIDPLQPLRADKLYQMGFNDAALGLAQGTTAPGVTPSDPREAVEQLLTLNNDGAACQQVDSVLAGGQMLDAFFRRAAIYCQISRQQSDAASLGLGLLRETAGEDAITQDFIALAALANGETKREPKLSAAPDAINLGLMKLSGISGPGAAATASVPVGTGGSLMVARDASRPLPERVAAAEQAFGLGLLPAAELGELYMQVPAGNADPATAIALTDTVELRAQLYQEARRNNQPAVRAKAIQAALKQARQRGDYLNQAELYMAFADAISPARDLAWFAPEGARLSFLAGKPEKGGYWLNTVSANPSVFAVAGEREGLELLGRIAGLSGSVQSDPVAAWRQASGIANPRIDLFYALMSGLGEPVANDVAGSFPAAPVVAVGSASAEIAAAAAGGRKGETITLALAVINGDRAIATDPAAMGTALRSLGAIGLAAESRRIAREIAVLAGL